MEDWQYFDAWYENERRKGKEPGINSRYICPEPKPTMNWSYYPGFCGCGCSVSGRRNYKTDCYFYYEDHQMGATIPVCTYHDAEFGQCPCDGCKKFISRSDVRELVLERVK